MRDLIIKICGITNPADARAALEAGADWIGLNFVGGPRRITVEAALEIVHGLPDPSPAVALFSVDDAKHPQTLDVLAGAGVRRIQLYGSVSSSNLASCAQRGFQTILVRAIGSEAHLADAASFLRACRPQPDFILADAYVPGQQGGTGRKADWNTLERAKGAGSLADWPPIVLAGGLSAQNVAEGIRRVSPAGIDAVSSLESRPGLKDPRRMREFVAAARRVA